jgi:gas vesicle protein
MAKGTKLILALLAGAAAGITIGMLLAPEKGEESRKKIASKAKKLADSVLEKAEDVIDKITNEKI